jgi:serine/threonine protein kinase
MEDPRLGLVLDGRYRIEARLAAGGTGVVYVATQLGLRRSVAIKFLHQSTMSSVERQGRFEREAAAMSRIAHPNVASIIDFGIDEESPYLVMELCRGLPLSDLIKDGPMELSRALQITRQILAGLSSAHDAGVVHRDLKPSNVVLIDSLDDHVKILDFGVAKVASEGPTELSVAAGRPLGTPRYMAPEQAKMEPVDARTDLYSLGIILYEMCTGKPPFDAGIGFALLRKQIEDEPKPPRKLRSMSRELEEVILKAMCKAPADRFQSAAEMRQALSQVPEMPVRRPQRSSRRILWSSAALVLVAAGAATWYAAEQSWIELPWLSESDTPPPSTTTARARPAPAPKRAPATVAARSAPVAKPKSPAWDPPPAEIEMGSDDLHAPIENSELQGLLANRPFSARFAELCVDDEKSFLRFRSQIGEEACSGTVPEGGPSISIPLPKRPVEATVLHGPRLEIHTSEGSLTTRAPWLVEFLEFDRKAGSAKGRIRLRGSKAELVGEFWASDCAAERERIPPRINGVSWSPERAPDPDTLPANRVAGLFGPLEFLPEAVHLTSGPAGPVLSFFAEAPLQGCGELSAAEAGVVVALSHDVLHVEAGVSTLVDEGADEDVRAGFQRGSCDASNECRATARSLAVKIDSMLDGEVRGRIYAAGPSRNLLTGAFRAIDCRK